MPIERPSPVDYRPRNLATDDDGRTGHGTRVTRRRRHASSSSRVVVVVVVETRCDARRRPCDDDDGCAFMTRVFDAYSNTRARYVRARVCVFDDDVVGRTMGDE